MSTQCSIPASPSCVHPGGEPATGREAPADSRVREALTVAWSRLLSPFVLCSGDSFFLKTWYVEGGSARARELEMSVGTKQHSILMTRVPQTTSRNTRIRSAKYDKNIEKRGNVPVGSASVSAGSAVGSSCLGEVLTAARKSRIYVTREQLAHGLALGRLLHQPTEAREGVPREPPRAGPVHLRRDRLR